MGGWGCVIGQGCGAAGRGTSKQMTTMPDVAGRSVLFVPHRFRPL